MAKFYVEAVGVRGTKVLDLACGTGRFTLPVAMSGAEITGGDLADNMLERARMSAREAGLSIEFVALDMRDFDLGDQRFDRIIIAANSLLHLETGQDFAGFFRAVRNHLAPDGQLVFDIFVPSIALLARDPSERHLLGEFMHAHWGKLRIEETTRYDPLTQVSHIDWYWSRAGEPDFWRNTLRMRQIFPEELPALLTSGGLRLVERFGDFDKSAFTAGSRHQVCVCTLI